MSGPVVLGLGGGTADKVRPLFSPLIFLNDGMKREEQHWTAKKDSRPRQLSG